MLEMLQSDMIVPQMIWLAIVGVLGFSSFLTMIRGLTLRGDDNLDELADTVFVECATCRWKGEVMRLRKRCPKCGDSNFIE